MRSIIFSNSCVSGKEGVRGRTGVGHDFRKRKLLTQPHHLVRSALRNLSAHPSQRQPCDYGHDFCFAKVATQPHYGQSILLRKTVYDRPVFFGVHTCAVSTSQFKSFLPRNTPLRLVKPQNIIRNHCMTLRFVII